MLEKKKKIFFLLCQFCFVFLPFWIQGIHDHLCFVYFCPLPTRSFTEDSQVGIRFPESIFFVQVFPCKSKHQFLISHSIYLFCGDCDFPAVSVFLFGANQILGLGTTTRCNKLFRGKKKRNTSKKIKGMNQNFYFLLLPMRKWPFLFHLDQNSCLIFCQNRRLQI